MIESLSRGGCALAVAFLGAGCSLSTQERAPVPQALKLSPTQQLCLDESLPVVTAFFSEEVSAARLNRAYQCAQDAVDLFLSTTRGQKADSYSPEEIRNFIHTYFLSESRISDALLRELMVLKRVLVGGGSDQITRNELHALQDFLRELQTDTLSLQPSMALLRASTDPQTFQDHDRIDAVTTDLNSSLGKLARRLSQTGQSYSFSQALALLKELRTLFKSEWNWVNEYERLLPLIIDVRNIVAKPSGDLVAPDDWEVLARQFSRAYEIYLRFRYNIRIPTWYSDLSLRNLRLSLEQGVSGLGEALSHQADNVISTSKINQVIEQLDKANLFRLPVQYSTVSRLLEPMIERVFNPRLSPSGEPLAPLDRPRQRGITKDVLKEISAFTLNWVEMHEHWQELEQKATARGISSQAIPLSLARNLWSETQPKHPQAWGDVKAMLDVPLVPLNTPTGEPVFAHSDTELLMDRRAFAELHWKQTLVRAFGNGYVADAGKRYWSGVNISELKTIFDDFRQLAIDLKYLEPTEMTIWKKAHIISNLVFYASDGDDLLSFNEAIDLFAISMASSAVTRALKTEILAGVNSGGSCTAQGQDVFAFPIIGLSCLWQRYLPNYPRLMSALPGWVNTLGQATPQRIETFKAALEQASRKPALLGQPLISSEVERGIGIHHYLESIMMRWDTDRRPGEAEILRLKETEKAFPLFRSVLQQASGFKDEFELRALFAYLLAYGEPPERSASGWVYWTWWKNNPDGWPARVAADRLRLLQIFAKLGGVLND